MSSANTNQQKITNYTHAAAVKKGKKEAQPVQEEEEDADEEENGKIKMTGNA